MADIKIDSKIFQERITHLATAWKNDLRSKDGQFGGAASIIVMMGKVEEAPELHKNNAIHVCFIDICALALAYLTYPSIVLASWLRVSDYAYALHCRHSLHPHNTEER